MHHEVAVRWLLPGPLAVAVKEFRRHVCALHERIVLAARLVKSNLLHVCHAGRFCQVTSNRTIHHETVDIDVETSSFGFPSSNV